jgi:serine/threonine-protein kinase RsbW
MRILVKNEISAIEPLSRVVSDFCLQHGLSDAMRDDINLALDEVVANVIIHGFTDSAEHDIIVRLSLDSGTVSVSVEDEGTPFNPLNAPEPDLSLPIEQRRVGGLGLHLVRNIMDELKYERRGERNCLFMKKRV